jgi:hypothetical protein
MKICIPVGRSLPASRSGPDFRAAFPPAGWLAAALFGAALLGLPAAKADPISKFPGGTTYFTMDWDTYARGNLSSQNSWPANMGPVFIVDTQDVGSSDVTTSPIHEGVLSAARGNVLQFSVQHTEGTFHRWRQVPVAALSNLPEGQNSFPQEGVWAMDVFQRSANGSGTGNTSRYGGFMFDAVGSNQWTNHGTMWNGNTTYAGEGGTTRLYNQYPRDEWFRYEVHFRPNPDNPAQYLYTDYINGVALEYPKGGTNTNFHPTINAYYMSPRSGYSNGPDYIRLTHLGAGSVAGSYILMDNITLSAVPEPALGLVAAGAGLLAVTGLRRVRRRR